MLISADFLLLATMPEKALKRGVQRVEVQSSMVTTEILRRTFRVSNAQVSCSCSHSKGELWYRVGG